MVCASQSLAGRPDTRVERRVLRNLSDSHRDTLRRLRVTAEEGVVTLAGEVACYYERQLAISCCQHADGVERIIDEVVVVER
jgi:osmotically-inducible protein OsmY